MVCATPHGVTGPQSDKIFKKIKMFIHMIKCSIWGPGSLPELRTSDHSCIPVKLPWISPDSMGLPEISRVTWQICSCSFWLRVGHVVIWIFQCKVQPIGSKKFGVPRTFRNMLKCCKYSVATTLQHFGLSNMSAHYEKLLQVHASQRMCCNIRLQCKLTTLTWW